MSLGVSCTGVPPGVDPAGIPPGVALVGVPPGVDLVVLRGVDLAGGSF